MASKDDGNITDEALAKAIANSLGLSDLRGAEIAALRQRLDSEAATLAHIAASDGDSWHNRTRKVRAMASKDGGDITDEALAKAIANSSSLSDLRGAEIAALRRRLDSEAANLGGAKSSDNHSWNGRAEHKPKTPRTR